MINEEMSKEEKILYSNYYRLTDAQKRDIISLKQHLNLSTDEIARKYNITPPDVDRIIHPPRNYGKWTAEQKKKHWIAGQRRSATVKKNRDQKELLNKPRYLETKL